MTPTIRIDNISKRYRVAANTAVPMNLTESLAAGVRNTVQKFRRLADPSAVRPEEEFWALKGVSFEVQPGEVVGIVGKNGAGKSTLLKVLSRITEPTSGRIELRGRLGSLLEVGTGFHPELTGRENIYLNGSILGMSRAEIRRQFDAIVAFSEIGPFLDTPVKRYSSGMYVRLAFAVAAHLDPEILIVDEVLAVGDAAFQKKCLDKMRSVAENGRTVLVVSHQTEVILRLCQRVIQLSGGQVARAGPSKAVMGEYLAEASGTLVPGRPLDLEGASRSGTGDARFTRVTVRGDGDDWPNPGGPLTVDCEITARVPLSADSLAVTLYDPSGFKLVNADTVSLNRPITLREGVNRVRVSVAALHLLPGQYRLGLYIARRPRTVFDHIENVADLVVAARADDILGPRPDCDGVVACDFNMAEL